MKRKMFLFLSLFLCTFCAVAQEDNEKKDAEKSEGYVFTDLIDLEATSVKDQNRSGTCWSFSANSFFEQEMIRMGKPATDLSEMFVVRHCYFDKAVKYVRMHGKTNFSPGGAFHDILHVMENYGMVPESVYAGLNYGEEKHVHGEMDAMLESMVGAVVENKNRKLSPAWKKAIDGTLDAYLGELPESFFFEGKTYTPKSFLSDYTGLNPADYVAITSYTHHPFYEEFIFEVPDNWLWKKMHNVPLEEMMEVIDFALENGYSVAWASDVSEKGFSTKKHGIAIVPEEAEATKDNAEIDKWEKSEEKKPDPFEKPGKEKEITQEMRQEAFDNYESTDDHGMHFIGVAKDQHGSRYYKVKNSWGAYNKEGGTFYASLPFVAYKTVNILVHKDALPSSIKKKLNIK